MARSRWVVCVLLATTSGCYNPKPAGIAISGRVTHQGKPIKEGMLWIQADLDTPSRSASARIDNGWYSIAREDGPTPGQFTVQIVGLQQVPDPEGRAFSTTVVTSEIPEKYNKNSELRLILTKRSAIELMFDLD